LKKSNDKSGRRKNQPVVKINRRKILDPSGPTSLDICTKWSRTSYLDHDNGQGLQNRNIGLRDGGMKPMLTDTGSVAAGAARMSWIGLNAARQRKPPTQLASKGISSVVVLAKPPNE
jgi:hypothetical protein